MTIEVDTPDGVLYYTIMEEDNQPTKVISTFGKTGTSLAAWSFAVDQLVNLLFEKGTKVNEILEVLSSITTEKPKVTLKGVRVGSGPEGLVVALMEYKRQKYRELSASFNPEDEDSEVD